MDLTFKNLEDTIIAIQQDIDINLKESISSVTERAEKLELNPLRKEPNFMLDFNKEGGNKFKQNYRFKLSLLLNKLYDHIF